jgi:tRNA A-37 threonylcarbamoyl transferase component Bud32
MSEDDGGAGRSPGGTHEVPEGYADLSRIDEGGFAVVYRARDTRFDRMVALKILRSERLGDRQLRRFRAECLATGRVCSHPNIVTVYDAGTTSGHRPWLAMEYCSGGSLAHRLATQGPLPVADVISIGARLCSALSAAHQAGILHRDVKPHNVLLTSYGEPALADFGIASVVVEDETVTETAAYTVVHAAPEILAGKAGTAATDIYSLGSTLYTLLAGQAPFAKEASAGLGPLVTRILSNDLPAIARPGVPPELEQLLRRSMAAEPQDRPAPAELGASLAALGQRLAAEEFSARPRPPAPAAARSSAAPVAPPVSAGRLLLILCGALGTLLAAFTAWGPTHGTALPHRVSASPVAAQGAQVADRYAPEDVVVTPGPDKGELTLSWRMPIRPDVVATVVYEGAGAVKARSVVIYGAHPRTVPAVPAVPAVPTVPGVPQATLHGLPRGKEVCLSATHVVFLGESIADAASRPVCAAPP